ncbi:MAG TPA: hypothetical protein VIR13_02115 [Savagea sp.]
MDTKLISKSEQWFGLAIAFVSLIYTFPFIVNLCSTWFTKTFDIATYIGTIMKGSMNL